jgi:hypothetical protein
MRSPLHLHVSIYPRLSALINISVIDSRYLETATTRVIFVVSSCMKIVLHDDRGYAGN